MKTKAIFHNFSLTVLSVLLMLFLSGCFLMYGPIPYFRDVWISTAMGTTAHHWLAGILFDRKTINRIAKENVTNVPAENTDSTQITVTNKVPPDNATELPASAGDGEKVIDGIGYIRLHAKSKMGTWYNGWMIKVYQASRLYIGVSDQLGSKGERLSHMVTRLGADAGTNAGAFVDPDGHGNGGEPRGVFICDGRFVTGANSEGVHPIIGFDSGNKLILGYYTCSELQSQHIQYGFEYFPFLIVNGKLSEVSGYSLQPRTSVGQTKDGVVLLLVIDGRSASSLGATMEDVQDLMVRYGAVNASAMDGGSSTVFAYKGKVINQPCGPAGERYLPNGFLIRPKS